MKNTCFGFILDKVSFEGRITMRN